MVTRRGGPGKNFDSASPSGSTLPKVGLLLLLLGCLVASGLSNVTGTFGPGTTTRAPAQLTNAAAPEFTTPQGAPAAPPHGRGGSASPQNGASPTWAYLGNSGPAARSNPAFTDDPADGYVLMFGGFSASYTDLGDTWAFLHGTWTELYAPTEGPHSVTFLCYVYVGGLNQSTTAACPEARDGAVMAYDSGAGYVLMQGGEGPGGRQLTDTWEFSDGSWTNITSTAGQTATGYEGNMAYDAADGYMVLFGDGNTYEFVAGAWVLDSSSPTNPGDEEYGVMVYDALDGYVLLWSGDAASCAPCGDTWSFSGGVWTQLESQTFGPEYVGDTCYLWSDGVNDTGTIVPCPLGEENSQGAFDVADGYVVVANGYGENGYDYSTWTWANGGWTDRSQSPYFGSAFNAGMTYDSEDGYTLGYGGYSGLSAESYVYAYGVPLATTTPASSHPSIDFTQSVNFTTTASGGGSGTYTYAWSGLPTGCAPANAYRWYVDCTPTVAPPTSQVYTIRVTVIDSDGWPSAASPASLSFTVYALPTVGAVSFVPPSSDVGEKVNFSVAASLGTGTYVNFSWSESSPALGCVASNASYELCVPTSTGPFTTSVWVQDSNDGNSTPSISSAVTFDAAPVVTAPVPFPAVVDVGQWVNFTTSASLGSLVYTSFGWSNSSLGLGCLPSTNATLTCHTNTAGTATVGVNVTDSNGGRSTGVSSAPFTVHGPLSANVPSAFPGSVDVGQWVNFTTSGVGGSSVYTAFTWTVTSSSLGCAASTNATLTCHPTAPVSTHVSVTVTDSSGTISPSATSSLFVVYADPTVSAPTASPSAADVGQQVVFTSTVTNAGSAHDTLAWSGFGSGLGCSASTTVTLTCIPTATGSYSATLTITDGNGGVGFATSTALVVSSDPSLSVPAPSVTVGRVNSSLTFTSTLTGSGSGSPVYLWSWSAMGLGCTASTTLMLTCTPTSAGTYTVTVNVTDSNLWTSSETSAPLSVFYEPKVSSPVADHSSVDVGQSVSFTSSVVNAGAGGDTEAWTVDPSSGLGCTSSTSLTFSCQPSSAGLYNVTIVLTDQDEATSTQALASFVVSPVPTVSAPVPSPSSITLGSSVTFTATVTGTGSGGDVLAWNPSSAALGCAISTTATVSCTPTGTGSYTVTFMVTDSNGGSASATSGAVTVTSPPPALLVGASASPTSAAPGASIAFTAKVTGGAGTFTYSWRFGDGSGSSQADPIHAFASAGTYTAEVWVNDSVGQQAQSTVSITITSPSGGSSGAFGLSTVAGAGVLGAIVLVVVILVVLLLLRRRKSPPASSAKDEGPTESSGEPKEGGSPAETKPEADVESPKEGEAGPSPPPDSGPAREALDDAD